MVEVAFFIFIVAKMAVIWLPFIFFEKIFKNLKPNGNLICNNSRTTKTAQKNYLMRKEKRNEYDLL